MGIKEAWQGLIGKTDKNELIQTEKETAIQQIADADLFPIVKIPETYLQKYRKIPISGLATLGEAFSKLPAVTKSIGQLNTPLPQNETLYRAINPKHIVGELSKGKYGINGNIMQVNSEGKNVIKGRLQFEKVNGRSLQGNMPPFDPTMMVVAVAIMAIEQKLDKIQESIDELIRFLELEKQATQRGNLKKLAEIATDYKIYCEDNDFCTNRNIIVQEIQTKAFTDMEFYKERIFSQLQKQKALYLSNNADSLMNNIIHEFAEYQLSCYLYSYCTFMDTMLRKDFSTKNIERSREKMLALSDEYDSLYSDCYSQIEKYQNGSIDAKLVDGVGVVINQLGKVAASIPIVKEKQFDETLIEARNKLDNKKSCVIDNKLEAVKAFEDNRIAPFIENLLSMDLMYNGENAMLTDGENVYVLETR